MHDRYFFAADVLTIVLAFLVPRLIPLAIVVQVVSLLSGAQFLGGDDLVPLVVLAAVELGAAVVLCAWLVDRGRADQGLGRAWARESSNRDGG